MKNLGIMCAFNALMLCCSKTVLLKASLIPYCKLHDSTHFLSEPSTFVSDDEAMMRSKREVGWEDDYEGDYEDYDEEAMNDYEDPNPDPDSGEIDEEEPDVDYVDGEPVSGNIADKDDEIKDEL